MRRGRNDSSGLRIDCSIVNDAIMYLYGPRHYGKHIKSSTATKRTGIVNDVGRNVFSPWNVFS